MLLRTLPLAWLALGCGDNLVPPVHDAQLDGSCTGTFGGVRVLAFSRENLWNHGSNPIAQQALLDMCRTRGYSVVASRDPLVFENGQLDDTDVVVFAVSSGPVLNPPGEANLQTWLTAGHGMVGIHSATATELDDAFFIDAMGGQFQGHYPGLVPATLNVVDTNHPIMAGYPVTQTRTDEWYSFWYHPDTYPGTTVLATLDESTMPADYPADLKMGVHPMAWTHEGYGGRTFYFALGHTEESYSDPAFLDVIAHGIAWAGNAP